MDIIKEYLDSLKTDGLKPSTIKHARITLNKFNNGIDGKSLLEIDKHDIDTFIIALSETCNQKTTKSHIGRLNLFYEYLVEDEEIINHNPVKRKAKRLTNGNNHTNRPKRTFEEVKEFAAHRKGRASPYGWRRFLVSQQDYIRFCCSATIRVLLNGRREARFADEMRER